MDELNKILTVLLRHEVYEVKKKRNRYYSYEDARQEVGEDGRGYLERLKVRRIEAGAKPEDVQASVDAYLKRAQVILDRRGPDII